MGFYDWMLALHLLAALAIAAALVLYAPLVLAAGRGTTLADARLLFRVARIATPLIGAGSLLALAFGIALAIDSPDYKVWDGWVIAGIILWAGLGAAGGRAGAYYTEIQKVADGGAPDAEQQVAARLRAPAGRILPLAAAAIFVLALLDMLFKPGA